MPLLLSQMIQDARVRAAFERAERDQGGPVMALSPVPHPMPPAPAEAQSELETCE